MAKTENKETFTDLFKTTTDKTKGILKKETKKATTKAKSIFGGGSTGSSTSIWDTFKNMFSQFSVPSTTTKSGRIKFKTPKTSSTPSVDFLKSTKGLIIVGIGTLAGMYFLTKPKKSRS